MIRTYFHCSDKGNISSSCLDTKLRNSKTIFINRLKIKDKYAKLCELKKIEGILWQKKWFCVLIILSTQSILDIYEMLTTISSFWNEWWSMIKNWNFQTQLKMTNENKTIKNWNKFVQQSAQLWFLLLKRRPKNRV